MRFQPASVVLSLWYAGSAAALGLGELAVHSHLGQPLHATVRLLDPAASTVAECFLLAPTEGGVAPLPRAQLSLEGGSGATLLHIRTAQAVNDPVAQFVLVADCETRLQRDYVVLLDPPAAVAPPAQAESARPAAAAAAKSVKVPTRVRRSAGDTPAAGSKSASPRARAATHAAPRLVLSGRRLASEGPAAFALKLDTSLPDLTRGRPDGLSVTEMSDENTALTRKLAYLESQLVALQRRNAELEARRPPAAPDAVKPPPPRQTPQWPLFLLLAGLLAGAGTLVAWFRSRGRQTNPASDLDDLWIPEPVPAGARPGGPAAAPAEASLDRAPEQTAQPVAPERMPDVAPPTLVESTEVKDDILDQAEVYMAHGHGELAIHLLQEHLRAAPDESPVPWLLLLDLLQREGDTAAYATASAECRRYFNVNLGSHPVSQDTDQGRGLETYPHLLDRLLSVWNTPDVDAFFRELIYDDRGGTRMGFEPGAYRDILLLRAIAQDKLLLAA